MQHPYSARITYKAKRGPWPAIAGELYEKDVLIAKFWRNGVRDGYVPPIEYRFLSEASKSRFDDFADCLSISESIEALIPV
jgi:hypothetical protein